MAADFPELLIKSFSDLADALLTVKNHLGLSNETVEQIAGAGAGWCDKYLGRARTKRISATSFNLLMGTLALRLRVEVDPDQERLVRGRWAQKNTKQVRVLPPHPFTKKQLEYAKQIIFAEHTRKATLASLAARQAHHRPARNGHNGHRHNGHVAGR